MNENSFIFDDPSSSFLFCDSITAQCSKESRFARTHRQGGNHQSRSVLSSLDVDNVHKKKKDIDQHLATAMKSLSVKERNAALEEVNGILDNHLENLESPAILDQKLIELDQYLHRIKRASVYETAECTNPTYVQNRRFRLMFLRGRRYNVKEAAEQMMDFFEQKLMLFGKEKLCKDITLYDLDEDERLAIRKGGLQLVEKDVGGRMVCTHFRGLVKQKSILNELRTKYYTTMTMLDNEEIQKKGAIGLLYTIGDRYKDKTSGGAGIAKLGRLAGSLPIHWAAFHFCCDDVVQFVLIQALIFGFPTFLAAKFRCHFGTHQECMYSLRSYGIPCTAIPIAEADDSKPPLLCKHLIWYQNREKVDQEKDANWGRCPSSTKERLDSDCTSADITYNGREFSQEEGDTHQNQQQQVDVSPLHKSVRSPDLTPPGSQGPFNGGINVDTASNTAITPRRIDILFGIKYKSHPGTLELQEIVSKQLPVFESIVLRTEKTKFVDSLVKQLSASGIRFLEKNDETNSWIEVDHKLARKKVAKNFRNKRRTTGLGPSFWESMAKVSNQRLS